MFNFGQSEWTSLIYQVILIGFLGMSLFIGTKSDKSLKIKQLFIWIAIIIVGVLIYNNRQKFTKFIPYVAKSSTEENAFEIEKSSDGHFYLMLNIDGTNVLFMIDTGASYTTLTLKDAKRVGVNVDNLKYRVPVNTAKGMTFNAQSKVGYVKINGIIIKDNLQIFVSRELEGNSLLGMNFLKELRSYRVEQDKMILYY